MSGLFFFFSTKDLKRFFVCGGFLCSEDQTYGIFYIDFNKQVDEREVGYLCCKVNAIDRYFTHLNKKNHRRLSFRPNLF